MRLIYLLGFMVIGLCLVSCTTPLMQHDHTGRVCKALNDDITFKPLTSNIRRQQIANSNKPLAVMNYDQHGCEPNYIPHGIISQ